MNPMLTIYVPTARPCVTALLDSLIPQIQPGVEVIVSDNTGNAEAACFCQPVTYERRRYNIGGDANILRSATAGTGEWVWVVGDDDVLLPGAVSRTIETLRWANPDRLIHFDPTAPMPVTGFSGSLRELLAIITPDPSLLIAATLITANVLRRSILDIPLGLRMIDTHYPLMWASLAAGRYAVADEAAFEVGINPAVDPQRTDLRTEWRELLLALSATCGWQQPFDDRRGWNFVSARNGALHAT